ncbi:MAG: hypothetical protein JXB42_12470 [Deltaproteobacteria bacterium]|nr:hypothetical protein [Deltaproteobacteria bacterium]
MAPFLFCWDSLKCAGSVGFTAEKLRSRFGLYDALDRFIHAVKVQEWINPAWHLTRIREIFDNYDDEDCIRCMEEYERYTAYSYPFVKGFLMSYAAMKSAVQEPLGILQCYDDIAVTRDLKEYLL